jgi:3-oxoacyl-[acyl-carrier protein] reductase
LEEKGRLSAFRTPKQPNYDTRIEARALASEFAAQNIRANVVSPGSIDTRRDNPEWYQGRAPSAAGIPLGRQGQVDEIAATCLFLVSDDGGFITGQTIHVNSGTGYY